MKSWPKVKLGKVQVGSNIAQRSYIQEIKKSYQIAFEKIGKK